MYAVGHITLGYLMWKLIDREGSLNLPAICLLSILPDVDLLIRGLRHRGPTHSLIAAFIVFVPLLIIKKREMLAYLVVLLSHSAIGDYFIGGGVQLLWPVSQQWMKFPLAIGIKNPLEPALELLLFVISVVVLVISRDYEQLFNVREDGGSSRAPKNGTVSSN
jgi:membrane-bound metal-dependent hydrolase YbcI (DUF457 family)